MASPIAVATSTRTITVDLKKDNNSNSKSPHTTTTTTTTTTTKDYIICSIVEDSDDSVDGKDTTANLSTWTNFCAFCFSYKPSPPPASYFRRHYDNDPRRDASLIRVAIDPVTNEIVSSVRIFRRIISTGDESPSTMEACGIGEVCTHPDHRGRGLARVLLHDAIRLMELLGGKEEEEGRKDASSVCCSLLHAGPSLMAVYERSGGYEYVTTQWSVVKLNSSFLTGSSEKEAQYSIRNACFPEDTPTLHRIHANYSEKRFGGCIVRSEQYWNEYVSLELGDSLFVLEKEESVGDKHLVAWLSIRPRGGKNRYQLREFGADTKQIQTSVALTLLVCFALNVEQQNKVKDKKGANNDETALELILPTSILEEMRGGEGEKEDTQLVDWKASIQSEDDIGWMYRSISHCSGDKEGKVKGTSNDATDSKSMNEWTKKKGVDHLIWPTDSF